MKEICIWSGKLLKCDLKVKKMPLPLHHIRPSVTFSFDLHIIPTTLLITNHNALFITIIFESLIIDVGADLRSGIQFGAFEYDGNLYGSV